jgi:hypothetical protein
LPFFAPVQIGCLNRSVRACRTRIVGRSVPATIGPVGGEAKLVDVKFCKCGCADRKLYPDSGKKLAILSIYADFRVMSEPTELEDLIAYLVRTTRLRRAEASRLVGEVLSFLDERPEEFVCRRHRALQGEGLSNTEIFARIAVELSRWRFRAPAYSERQLRRIVYG